MPSRVIRAQINSSRSLARVSLQADLVFRCLLVAVDDFGRIEADPLVLKADLFPRRKNLEPEAIDPWIRELEGDGCVLRYAVDGVEYLQLTGWEKHRGKTNRAKCSRYPEPNGNASMISESPGDPRKSVNLPPSSSSSSSISLSGRPRPGGSDAASAAKAIGSRGALVTDEEFEYSRGLKTGEWSTLAQYHAAKTRGSPS